MDNNALTKGSRTFNPFILLIPALCDMIATSIMYIGLNMTYASSFQMLRGAVIVFTGMFSVGFLNRKLGTREWTGIGLVIVGLAFVGASDILTMDNSDISANSVITGDLLIILAQVLELLLLDLLSVIECNVSEKRRGKRAKKRESYMIMFDEYLYLKKKIIIMDINTGNTGSSDGCRGKIRR